MIQLLLVAALCAGMVGPAMAETLRFMTGPRDGVWVSLAAMLKPLLEQEFPGVAIETLPGAGIANVRAIDEGGAELAFANSVSTVDALSGRPPFQRPVTEVCQMASLYPQYFHVVVLADAGIETISGLQGRSLAVQSRGSTAEVITRHLLRAFDLGYKEIGRINFVGSYSDAAALLKEGYAQALTAGAVLPATAILDLSRSRDVRLLTIPPDRFDLMRRISPAYSLVTIKAGTYPKQVEDVPVIGYAAHLIANCALPEDQAHAIVASLVRHLPELAAVVSAMAGVTPEMMAADMGVPFHPGALRFYREIGIHP